MSDNGFSWDKIIGQSGDQLPESKDKDAELSDILRQISDRGKTSEPEPSAPVAEPQPAEPQPEVPAAAPVVPPVMEEIPAVTAPPVTEEFPIIDQPVKVDSNPHVPVDPEFPSVPDVFANRTPEPANPTAEVFGYARPTSAEEEKPELSVFGAGAGENDGHTPAFVPKDVREPEKAKGKYYVDENLQEQGIVRTGEDVKPVAEIHIDELLRMAVERKASDIHLTAGLPPMVRMDGEVVPLPYEILDPQQTQRLIYEVLTDEQLEKFENTRELDFGYSVKGLARFRFNVYMQRNAVAGALRMIPNRIPSFDELRLPSVIREIAKRHSGMILVTGPTGSGKSTTIASMIDDINETRQAHILTIEDPIEYLHKHKKCMVNQREMHSDTYSFHNALRAVLREDPDIILVGELRDLETIEAALTLAETGHLVFGTLHTRNAPATIDRVVDVFPADQQDQIRVLLANTIEGIISQQLLPKLGGGRVAALEIMTGLPSVKNLIREGKTHQMYSVIETSKNVGMRTMDASLADLFRQGYVSYEECLMRAVDKESFARLAKGAA